MSRCCPLLMVLSLFLPVGGPSAAQPGRDKTKKGEINTPPAKGERVKDAIKVGDPAPDFTLAQLKSDRTVTLSKFKNTKPVVLIFGSYT